MRDGIMALYDRYRLPIYIAENGLSCNDMRYQDGKVHDSNRIEFLEQYLEELSNAVAQKADVRGYFHWSLGDRSEERRVGEEWRDVGDIGVERGE